MATVVDTYFEQNLDYHPGNGQAGSNLITVAQLHAVLSDLLVEVSQPPLVTENQ